MGKLRQIGRKIDDEIIEPIKENPAAAVGVALMFVPGLQGVGASLGSALGASGAVASGLGNAIIQGALTEAQGGDFLKGAALSGVGSVAGGFIQPGLSQALGGGVAGNIASNALIGGGMSELSGGDFASGALISGVGSGLNQAINKIKSFSAYTPNADGSLTYQWDDGSQITIDNQANVLGYSPSSDFVNAPIASQQAQQDIQNKLSVLGAAKSLTPYAITTLLAKNAYDTATKDDQGNLQYSVVPIPTDWKSPEYDQTFTPSAPIEFGNSGMLAGTQFANQPAAATPSFYNLSDVINTLNFDSVPFVQQQLQMPQQSFDVPDILQQFQTPNNIGMNDTIGNLDGSPATLNSIIAGIQSQYG